MMERNFKTGLALIAALGDLVNATTCLKCIEKLDTATYFTFYGFEVQVFNEITKEHGRNVYRVEDLRYALNNYEKLKHDEHIRFLRYRFGIEKLRDCLTKGASSFIYFGIEFTIDDVKEAIKLVETELLEFVGDLNEGQRILDNKPATSTHYDLNSKNYVRYDCGWRHYVNYRWLKIPRGSNPNLIDLAELNYALQGAAA
ncbi:hypothetical protein QDS01_18040 [Acinetobacter nosocomialis]|uniref:hypothetical protein n=1 Tax=Acinetobacter nosocomialis TaxID=106654 RepID=UPI00244A663D|nr:hypothetical protein [Acinetobacter nosocomialis]MDH2636813.1 hypothetical protein [Acinetobacter nosocomialis]